MHRRRAVNGLQQKIQSLQQKWIFEMGSSHRKTSRETFYFPRNLIDWSYDER